MNSNNTIDHNNTNNCANQVQGQMVMVNSGTTAPPPMAAATAPQQPPAMVMVQRDNVQQPLPQPPAPSATSQTSGNAPNSVPLPIFDSSENVSSLGVGTTQQPQQTLPVGQAAQQVGVIGRPMGSTDTLHQLSHPPAPTSSGAPVMNTGHVFAGVQEHSFRSNSSTNESGSNSGNAPGVGMFVLNSQNVSGEGSPQACDQPPYGAEEDDLNSAAMCNCYVASLPLDTTEADLRRLFRQFGPIRVVSVKRGHGYGFVLFEDPQSAEQAVINLAGSVYQNQRIQVRLSKYGPARNLKRKNSRPTHNTTPPQTGAPQGPPGEVAGQPQVQLLQQQQVSPSILNVMQPPTAQQVVGAPPPAFNQHSHLHGTAAAPLQQSPISPAQLVSAQPTAPIAMQPPPQMQQETSNILHQPQVVQQPATTSAVDHAALKAALDKLAQGIVNASLSLPPATTETLLSSLNAARAAAYLAPVVMLASQQQQQQQPLAPPVGANFAEKQSPAVMQHAPPLQPQQQQQVVQNFVGTPSITQQPITQ